MLRPFYLPVDNEFFAFKPLGCQAVPDTFKQVEVLDVDVPDQAPQSQLRKREALVRDLEFGYPFG